MVHKKYRRRPVSYQNNGKIYYGTYTIERPLVTITWGMALNQLLLSELDSHALAKLLLSELVENSKSFS